MEFRQVVHCARRTAAAAASRPSALSTRAAPSSLLFQHSHSFTTNSKQQSEAAAVAQPRSQPSPSHHRVAQLRAAASQNPSTLPPRPAPIRSNMFDREARGASRSWAVPSGASSGQQLSNPAATRTTTPTPTPTGAATAPRVADPFDLPAQIEADMRAATSGPQLRTWDADNFVNAHYKAEPALRLRPSTGRTVSVKGTVDLARAFRMLGRSVAQNRVRSDEAQQRFHERPALKRKRQLRERWRARFKEGFRACILRARELKAQGW